MPSNAFVRPSKFSCVISSAILIFLESMGGLNFTSYWQRCQSGVISNLKQLVTTGKARPEVPYSKTKKTSVSNDLQSNGNLFLQYFFTKWKKLECRGFFLPLKKMSTRLFTCYCFLKTVQHSMVTILIHSRASLSKIQQRFESAHIIYF